MDKEEHPIFNSKEINYFSVLLSKEMSNLYRRYNSLSDSVLLNPDNEYWKKDLDNVSERLSICNSIFSKLKLK